MKRLLRRILRLIVPEGLKARYRARRFAARGSSPPIPLEFAETSDGLIAHVNRTFNVRITADEQANLRYHLEENGSSIDEMTGFLVAAKNARLFWDVGAHKGVFALFFCLSGAEKRAVAFEPSAELLERAIELGALNGLNGRIEWSSSAIGNRVGRSRFAVQNTGFLTVACEDEATVEVPLTTLDAEWKARGAAPDLLKIDVEG